MHDFVSLLLQSSVITPFPLAEKSSAGKNLEVQEEEPVAEEEREDTPPPLEGDKVTTEDDSDSREGSIEGGSDEVSSGGDNAASSEPDAGAIFRKRQMLFQGKLAVNKKRQNKQAKVPKKGKEARVWDLDGKDSNALDYSRSKGEANGINGGCRPDYLPSHEQIGTLSGSLRNMDLPSESETKKTGLFSMFSSLVSGKTLESADVAPALEKFKDTLIGKNVAAEIATKLCASVETKLIGKHVGSFEGISSVVKSTLTESLMHLLTPKRRLDILRDVREAQANRRPYSITFCGVNGVGKSTNLAKVHFIFFTFVARVLFLSVFEILR